LYECSREVLGKANVAMATVEKGGGVRQGGPCSATEKYREIVRRLY